MKTAPLFFLTSGLLSLSLNAFGVSEFCSGAWRKSAKIAELSENPEWLRLLHFRRNQTRFSSQADGRDFFISESGDRDPKAELVATIAGFCEKRVREVHQYKLKKQAVYCQFPARRRWLKSEWPEFEVPILECPDLEEWRHRMRPKSIRLVFSSYYANNPSSVFGHTLLRLDPQSPGEPGGSPLLSSGINFAAEVGPINPVIYAFNGLVGLFPGKFTAIPYYYKVREYSDFDSRDLWEYELKLTPEELQQFVDHIWEMGFTYFNYYYFTENCSYQLLAALEGAVPRLNASPSIPWWVIPADSVKAIIRSPEMLGRVDFRPSLYRQYLTRRDLLNKNEFRSMRKIVDRREVDDIESFTPERQAAVLDAALDYWDYKYAHELIKNEPDKQIFKQTLLALRSKRPTAQPITIERPDRPDLSHESMRYGLYSKSQALKTGTLGLDLRFALHDWLDPQDGYPENAKIVFYQFKIDGLQNRSGQWKSIPRLTDFKFFEVFLLSPISQDNLKFSWRATMGADRRWGLGCEECLAPQVDLVGGGTLGLFGSRLFLFSLAGGQVRWSPEIEPYEFLLVPTWMSGLRFKFSRRLLLWGEFDREYLIGMDGDAGWRAKTEIRYSPTLDYSFGLGWDFDGWKDQQTALAQFYLFR